MLNRVRPLHKGHLKTGVDSFCTEVETRFSAINKMKLSTKRDWKTLANFGQGFCNKVVPSLSLRCEAILLELRAKPWVACEQALCLGKKIARPLSLVPARPKACSQATNNNSTANIYTMRNLQDLVFTDFQTFDLVCMSSVFWFYFLV